MPSLRLKQIPRRLVDLTRILRRRRTRPRTLERDEPHEPSAIEFYGT